MPGTSQEVGVEKPPVELPSEDELTNRLEILCVGGEGPPTESSGRVPGLTATNKLIQLVIDVVFDFFKLRKEEVRWVTEKAQLDKFDGVAYLLADLLRGELLLEEANLIGKRAHKHVTVDVPKHAEKCKQKAKEQRSHARTKVKRGMLAEADLEQTIADIDRTRDEAIAALWQDVYSGLDLPAENTVIVETRPRPEPTPLSHEEHIEELIEQKLDLEAELEATGELAIAAQSKRARAFEKLAKLPAPGGFKSEAGYEGVELGRWVDGWYEFMKGKPISDAERTRRVTQKERYFTAKAKALQTVSDAAAAKHNFEECRAQLQLTREMIITRREAVAAYHTQAADAIDKEVAENEKEIARLLVIEAADREKTRKKLHADAEAVWGSDWQSRPSAVVV